MVAQLNDNLTAVATNTLSVTDIPNTNAVLENNDFIEAMHVSKVGEYYMIAGRAYDFNVKDRRRRL